MPSNGTRYSRADSRHELNTFMHIINFVDPNYAKLHQLLLMNLSWIHILHKATPLGAITPFPNWCFY